MGITFGLLEQLHDRDVFKTPGAHVLDIGCSNLYIANREQIAKFVQHFKPEEGEAEIKEFAERLAKGSYYDSFKGGINEAFAGELLEMAGMTYVSFDIAGGYNTEIFDLNVDSVRGRHYAAYDLVLNVGTTEHVLNQLNAFNVIHNAAKAGGFIVHQLPVAGFTDHGYFVYTSRLFFDLARFNHYEIADLWYDGPAGNDDLYKGLKCYRKHFPTLKEAPATPVTAPNCSITIIYKKKTSKPFVPCLETSASVGRIPGAIKTRYYGSFFTRIAAAVKSRRFRSMLRRVLGERK